MILLSEKNLNKLLRNIKNMGFLWYNVINKFLGYCETAVTLGIMNTSLFAVSYN